MVLFFLCCAAVQAREEKPAEPQATGSIKSFSRLAGDPGEITEKNAPLFKTSDGSSLEGLASYKGQQNASGYQNIRYSRTVLSDDARKLNKNAADFFADEQARRNDLNMKITAGRVSQAGIAKARQDEIQRRQDFTRKQQARLDEINCRGVKTPVCDQVRDRNKKFFGLF